MADVHPSGGALDVGGASGPHRDVIGDSIWDVIVVGGGHAGIEAAHAAARMGQRTLLLTMALDAVGWMSCNPAIGGQAKGQIVREIDALGGLMGRITDQAAIQTRILNTGKGPAVQGPRAQCDKRLYAEAARLELERTDGLSLRQELVADVLVEGGCVAGVLSKSGEVYRARAVVLTTGTFLRGLMHEGEAKREGGRAGDGAAMELSPSLGRLGLAVGRLKTGTPPRLHGRTIDRARMAEQKGMDPPYRFSFAREHAPLPQVSCWVTHTTAATHAVIRANLHRSPMFSGQIEGVGPRYCPSIEDKVVRFAAKDRHLIFVEPEGLRTEEVYVNGISTSLPRDVQRALVQSIPGLERAEITRYGYAVEYDYFPPSQLTRALECRAIGGLFLAGQICGTSGYEEAAAQGIVAGIHAARKARGEGETEVVIGREQGYVGVLVSDLVGMEHREPYRMFSSRAEFRLLLRADNADQRLTPLGRKLGLVGDRAWAAFEERQAARASLERHLERRGAGGRTLGDLLKRPEVTLADLARDDPDLARLARDPDVAAPVETDVKYRGYIERQRADVERLRGLEAKAIPAGLDFASIGSISNEARSKLAKLRPDTLGQAARIAGVSPADVAALAVALRSV